jgi:hypothetical protein
MDFIKKHYEKIILGIVLAGLVGALVFMMFYISHDREVMEASSNNVTNPKTAGLTNLDLAANHATITRLATPAKLDFETGNRVFNPVDWVKNPDGTLTRATKIGPQTCVVTNIVPLYLIVTLDGVTTNEFGARYTIGVEKQSAPTAAKRHKTQRFVSVGDKPNDVFALVEIKGAAENPDTVVLKLIDSGEPATVAKENPFRRVDAYMADFRYDLEKKSFLRRRVGDRVTFGGTDYVVSDITQNAVGIVDQSNQRRTELPFNPAP